MTVAGIVVLWLLFAVTHLGLSSQALRPHAVARLGERNFTLAYSLVALATFVPLVWLYFANQHAGLALWYAGPGLAVRWLVYVGMGFALVLLVGGLLRPSPAAMAVLQGSPEVKGVLRLTRHPVFMSFGIFGLVHLLGARVNAAELAFFGGFPIFAAIGCWHQDQRKLAENAAGFGPFYASTCLFPLTGGGVFKGLAEMPVAVVVGIALTVVIRIFHPGWFGGAP